MVVALGGEVSGPLPSMFSMSCELKYVGKYADTCDTHNKSNKQAANFIVAPKYFDICTFVASRKFSFGVVQI